jgi:hypothetical protein
MVGLASAIQKGEVEFPPGVIVDELECFEYEYTRTGVRYSAPEGYHDDCVIALALAVEQRRRLMPQLDGKQARAWWQHRRGFQTAMWTATRTTEGGIDGRKEGERVTAHGQAEVRRFNTIGSPASASGAVSSMRSSSRTSRHKGRRVYREMSDNDPTVGAIIFAISMLLRQAKWDFKAADDSAEAEDAKSFSKMCSTKMKRPSKM